MANPVDVIITGKALNSFGLVTGGNAIAGLALNTFGFLTPCDAIWTDYSESVTTAWTNSLSGTVEICAD